MSSLAEVLRLEKEQYEELKAELSESKSPRAVKDRITNLKESIVLMEQQRQQTVEQHFPEFEQLREQNEILRQKTTAALTGMGDERAMREYLLEEEARRTEFMRNLQQSKAEYVRLTR